MSGIIVPAYHDDAVKLLEAALVMEFGSIIPKAPAKLLNYERLIYPQYESEVRGIPFDVWQWMQQEARQRIVTRPQVMDVRVRQHMQRIVDGIPPFGMYVMKESE